MDQTSNYYRLFILLIWFGPFIGLLGGSYYILNWLYALFFHKPILKTGLLESRSFYNHYGWSKGMIKPPLWRRILGILSYVLANFLLKIIIIEILDQHKHLTRGDYFSSDDEEELEMKRVSTGRFLANRLKGSEGEIFVHGRVLFLGKAAVALISTDQAFPRPTFHWWDIWAAALFPGYCLLFILTPLGLGAYMVIDFCLFSNPLYRPEYLTEINVLISWTIYFLMLLASLNSVKAGLYIRRVYGCLKNLVPAWEQDEYLAGYNKGTRLSIISGVVFITLSIMPLFGLNPNLILKLLHSSL